VEHVSKKLDVATIAPGMYFPVQLHLVEFMMQALQIYLGLM
jgi:hypothetical protein